MSLLTKNQRKKSSFWEKTIVIISLLLFTQIISPFLKEGLFLGHDSQLHSIYLVKFEEALKSGQLPVRWIDWFIPGYNQPLFNFYQPGFYYLYQIPRLLGFNHIASLNLSVIVLWILSAVLMYLFARRHFGKLGGLLSAYFYLLAPYHILDIFVRSAFPEFSALTFAPGIFWGLKAFSDTQLPRTASPLFASQAVRFAAHPWSKRPGLSRPQSKKYWYLSLTALFTALTLISHPPTLLMLSPLILSYIIYLSYIQKSFLALITYPLSLALGFGLISFFIIPAYFELSFAQTIYMRSGYYDYEHHFLCLSQPFVPSWGYRTSQTGCDDGISLQLGLIHWLVLLLITAILAFKFIFKKSKLPQKFYFDLKSIIPNTYYLILIFLGIFLACFYLLFEISEPIWENLPYIAYLQYSWRFLAVLSFISSFLAGALLLLFKKDNLKYGAFIALMLLATFAYSGYLKPAAYTNIPDSDFGKKIMHPSENLKNFDPEPGYMTHWTQILPDKNKPNTYEVELTSPTAKINQADLKANLKQYEFELPDPTHARFQTHYYPGWKVFVNNREVAPNYDNIYGFMDIDLPQGKHQVILKLEETPLRKFANTLSVVFIAITILLAFSQFVPKKFKIRR